MHDWFDPLGRGPYLDPYRPRSPRHLDPWSEERRREHARREQLRRQQLQNQQLQNQRVRAQRQWVEQEERRREAERRRLEQQRRASSEPDGRAQTTVEQRGAVEGLATAPAGPTHPSPKPNRQPQIVRETHAEDDATRDEEVTRIRQRLERDAEASVRREKRALLLDFTKVVDDLDRALDGAVESDLAEGVDLVRTSLLGKLDRHGVARREVSPGMVFDPEQHEAIASLPVEAERDNRIIEVLNAAYELDGELLRPAQVVVGRGA
ncbi:MAG: nucleotide exchange factor GrpE [Myxococcota bacterium]